MREAFQCYVDFQLEYIDQAEAQQVKRMQVALGMTFNHQDHTGEGWKDGLVEMETSKISSSYQPRNAKGTMDHCEERWEPWGVVVGRWTTRQGFCRNKQ